MQAPSVFHGIPYLGAATIIFGAQRSSTFTLSRTLSLIRLFFVIVMLARNDIKALPLLVLLAGLNVRLLTIFGIIIFSYYEIWLLPDRYFVALSSLASEVISTYVDMLDMYKGSTPSKELDS